MWRHPAGRFVHRARKVFRIAETSKERGRRHALCRRSSAGTAVKRLERCSRPAKHPRGGTPDDPRKESRWTPSRCHANTCSIAAGPSRFPTLPTPQTNPLGGRRNLRRWRDGGGNTDRGTTAVRFSVENSSRSRSKTPLRRFDPGTVGTTAKVTKGRLPEAPERLRGCTTQHDAVIRPFRDATIGQGCCDR